MASILPLLLLPVIFYFLLMRPQKKRQAQQAALLSGLAEGDEVVTAGGIYGFVTGIDDDVVWLEIAEGVEIRVLRQVIARRTPADELTGTEGTPPPPPVEHDTTPDEPKA